MTKEIIGPSGFEAERGTGDGEERLSSPGCSSPSELDKAISVRDDIRGKLDNARMALVEIDSERARIAFAATLTAALRRRIWTL